MNKEELDEIERTLKISKPYNELGTYNYFNCESIEKLLKQNTELKDNWNKLKEWLKEEYERCDKIGNPAIGCAMGQIKRIKSKMQEIEGGMNE